MGPNCIDHRAPPVAVETPSGLNPEQEDDPSSTCLLATADSSNSSCGKRPRSSSHCRNRKSGKHQDCRHCGLVQRGSEKSAEWSNEMDAHHLTENEVVHNTNEGTGSDCQETLVLPSDGIMQVDDDDEDVLISSLIVKSTATPDSANWPVKRYSASDRGLASISSSSQLDSLGENFEKMARPQDPADFFAVQLKPAAAAAPTSAVGLNINRHLPGKKASHTISAESIPSESCAALPMAKRLSDYVAPGGCHKYAPRPEWFLAADTLPVDTTAPIDTTFPATMRRVAPPVPHKSRFDSTCGLQNNSNEPVGALAIDVDPRTAATAALAVNLLQSIERVGAEQEHFMQENNLAPLEAQSSPILARRISTPRDYLGCRDDADPGSDADRRSSRRSSRLDPLEFLREMEQQTLHQLPQGSQVPAGADVAGSLAASTTLPTDTAASPSDWLSCFSSSITNSNNAHMMRSKPPTFGKDWDHALHVAIRESATEAAMQLIALGADVEAQNIKQITPIILAAQRGNLVVVRELLRRGANPASTTHNGTTAALQAAHFGHAEIVELLIRAGGPRLIEVANDNHTTPLMRAAQEGQTAVVKVLLDRGAQVNRRNRVYLTALMFAAQRGHADVCQLLIDAGADMDTMTDQNSTALVLACNRGHAQVVKVLVTTGCEIMIQDGRGRTARDVAQRRGNMEIVNLIDSAVQMDLMQRQGRRQRCWDMIRLYHLLQHDRATVIVGDDFGVSIHDVHHMERKQQQQHHHRDWTHRNFAQGSEQALVRTMALPAPLVRIIAEYIPLPNFWMKRIGMFTKRSMINADATVSSTLDLIDEILEEGGFLEACDEALVAPPSQFMNWRAWKAWGRQHGRVAAEPICGSRNGNNTNNHISRAAVSNVAVGPGIVGAGVAIAPVAARRENVTTATIPAPIDPVAPTFVEWRRQVGFAQLLATQWNKNGMLPRILTQPPYNMPLPLMKQVINCSDVASLTRRMGAGRGIHLDTTVAMDMVMLASRLCSWYWRERQHLTSNWNKDNHLSNKCPSFN